MNQSYILSCEHAGNLVPARYHSLFKGKEDVLYTHKAIDFGALRLAQHLKQESGLPLYYTLHSRLLVEANRSPDNEELFSDYTSALEETEKKSILEEYYYPHRRQVQDKISQLLADGRAVIQLAAHTFTPVLEGKTREADMGILFDPERPMEQAFADALKQELLAQNPSRKVLYNSPYPGTDDSFPAYLRKCFSKEQYGGIELEVNQKFFLNGDASIWETLLAEISAAFLAVIRK
ncbi:N-formylglutamate amidohydrolase [Cesiribacter sp. SM1]|uniref:N-formylglutamate amidohydrolase n=1 Tax=Cesiribacter sp. SM1 TaxID=2861196 RepID=UPI001CD30F5F|nr:N-formylglutamate amidohydrolase [Cesiribacter sp. SM1]